MDWIAASLLALVLSNAAMVCVLAAIAFGVTRFFRSPPLAHAIWIVVLLKLVTPPLISIPGTRLADFRDPAPERPQALPREEPPPTTVIGEAIDFVDEEEDPGAFSHLPEPTSLEAGGLPIAQLKEAPSGAPQEAGLPAIAVRAGVALWLLGTVLILGAAIARSLRFNRLLRRAPPAPSEVAGIVRAIAGKLGLRRTPAAVLVDARIPPLVWAFGAPARLVLPAALLAKLHSRETSTLIAHELAHLRRRDHWLRWPELLVVAVYWWHPVAWWARRELRRAEEECCDAWVQSECPGEIRDYANALLVTIDFLSGRRPAVPRTASGLGEGKPLIRRFEMILNTRLERRLSATLAGTLILASAALLPWAPGDAFGQTPPSGGSTDGDDYSTDATVEGDAGASSPDSGGLRGDDVSPRSRAGASTGGDSRQAAKDNPDALWPRSRTVPADARPSGDLEERLARLEEQVAALVGELRRQPKAAASAASGGAGRSPGADVATGGGAGVKLYEDVATGGRASVKLGAAGAGRMSATVRPGKAGKDTGRGSVSYNVDRGAGKISAVDTATGKLLWTQTLEGSDTFEHIVKPSPDGPLIRIDDASGELHIIDAKLPRDLKETREQLRSEMARLRKRLNDIEAREAEITKELGEEPATPRRGR